MQQQHQQPLQPRRRSHTPLLPLAIPSAGGSHSSHLPRRLLLFVSLFTFVYFTILHSNPRGPQLPRTADGRNSTFLEFTKQHVPASSRLWLTLSSEEYINSGTASMEIFLDRLNEERKERRGTTLIVLCLDEACERTCADKDWLCWSGFRWNRPEIMLESTWPKIAALIELLPHRHVTFVDSDVYFRYDPYPEMLPLMNVNDIIAQENDSWDHFNTGWIWFRSDPRTVSAWEQVLAKDLVEVSRDQNRFNDELDTARLRQWSDDPSRRPLKSDFVTATGLRVHILEDSKFRSYHFEIDRPIAERHESCYLHMTCGDDALTKNLVAKSQGFFMDIDGMYEDPPKLLSVEDSTWAGTKEELESALKMVLVVAHYTKRTFLPPASGSLTLQGTDGISSHKRPFYSLFPTAHIEEGFGIPIVEPGFVDHAVQHLNGASVLRKGRERELWVEDSVWEMRRTKAMGLVEKDELDIRQARTLASLVQTLLSPRFANSPHVQLINLNWPGAGSFWKEWDVKIVSNVKVCESIEDGPACGGICRGAKEFKLNGDWRGSVDL